MHSYKKKLKKKNTEILYKNSEEEKVVYLCTYSLMSNISTPNT